MEHLACASSVCLADNRDNTVREHLPPVVLVSDGFGRCARYLDDRLVGSSGMTVERLLSVTEAHTPTKMSLYHCGLFLSGPAMSTCMRLNLTLIGRGNSGASRLCFERLLC